LTGRIINEPGSQRFDGSLELESQWMLNGNVAGEVHDCKTGTAVTVEKILTGIHHEARLVILVKRAQPHPSTTAEASRGLPMMTLQIVQQRNLVF
jgi:hypothetical protein